MKVCLLAPANSIHTLKWYKLLKRSKFDVKVISLHEPKEFYNKEDVYYITPQFPLLGKVNYFLSFKKVKKIILDIEPDMLHAHYLSSYGIIAYLTKFNPLIVSVWGSDLFVRTKKIYFRYIIRKVLNNSIKICSTSYIMKDKLLELYPEIEKKVVITPFGVDTNTFTLLEKKNTTLVKIGIVKSLEDIYGIEYLIKAFHLSLEKFDNIELEIIGTGSQEKSLKSLVKSLQIEDKVKFIGFIENSQLVNYLNSWDIFVMPSIFESYGVAALEAQACGLPVIASKIGGLKEVIQDGETGLFFEPKDYMDLKEKLFFLLRNETRRKEMGLNARKHVLKNFSNESLSKNIVNQLYSRQ